MQDRKNAAEADGMHAVVDLADFPHGGLSSVRRDGRYDIEFYDVPEGVMVPAYDERSGAAVMRRVRYWSIHRGKKVEIVNLDGGRQIITDDDPRAVYGVPCDSGDLAPGRFTPSEAMDRHVMVPVVDDAPAEVLEGMYYCFGDGMVCGERRPHSAPVGFGLGQFVGIMAGCGRVSGGRVWMSDGEGSCRGFAEAFLGEVFPGTPSASARPSASAQLRASADEGDPPPVRCGGTAAHGLDAGAQCIADRVGELVYGHGDACSGSGPGSDGARLPIWYRLAGRDFILGLVNGLMAACGTVCASRSGAEPRLEISFYGASLRLAREFRRCCQLLGVRASISSGGNASGSDWPWKCSVSAADARKAGLLDRCCHAGKRGAFLEAEVADVADVADVDIPGGGEGDDVVPFPKGVAERLAPLVHSAMASVAGPGSPMEDGGDGEDGEEGCPGSMGSRSIAMDVRRHGRLGYITRGLVRAMRSLGEEAGAELRDSRDLADLERLAESNVKWARVRSVERTGRVEVGYDLTVPGPDTFVSDDGIVLSNTVNIHVPATDKAARQALDRMLPSKNLVSLTDLKSVRYRPEKEQVSGLWALTEAPASKPVRRFGSRAEAVKAYRNGEIGPSDPIDVPK